MAGEGIGTARSQQDAVGNEIYDALAMTAYPKNYDAPLVRPSTPDKLNKNMLGWQNIGDGTKPDYVMAEHVNALIDAVRSIQWTLGTTPMVPKAKQGETGATALNTQRTYTVKRRLDEMEDKNFDERYGGIGWTPSPTRTINNHTHDGTAGNPGKIVLTAGSHVTGVLPKANVDLTATTGITASDLKVSPQVTDTVAASLADKLSVENGGTVKGDVIFEGATQTRTTREYPTGAMSGASQVDSLTRSRLRKSFGGTAAGTFLSASLATLEYGRYVMGVRVKLVSGTLSGTTVLELRNTSGTTQASYFMASEFGEVGKWKTVYFVFDHEPTTTSSNLVEIKKLATGTALEIAVDHAYIQPVHPAIYDR